mmetsp:Transcript_36801/g.103838  ORF Transcript_36801/g.103838 Transcript_36801/m.103838 type:complete len:213 (-) Transcript_36801:1141-1779(-)
MMKSTTQENILWGVKTTLNLRLSFTELREVLTVSIRREEFTARRCSAGAWISKPKTSSGVTPLRPLRPISRGASSVERALALYRKMVPVEGVSAMPSRGNATTTGSRWEGMSTESSASALKSLRSGGAKLSAMPSSPFGGTIIPVVFLSKATNSPGSSGSVAPGAGPMLRLTVTVSAVGFRHTSCAETEPPGMVAKRTSSCMPGGSPTPTHS